MATTSDLHAVAPTWIWYPGDYEIWLGNELNNRRTERGAFFPPFWKADSHYVVVEFSKTVEPEHDEEITIACEGKFNIKLDGKLQFGMPRKFVIPAGKHQLNIKVHNQATPPALFIDGVTIKTDSSWRVTNEDKEWIDESGKASDTSTTVYMQAGCWNFNDIDTLPSAFRLSREQWQATASQQRGNGLLIDFGRETFGYLKLLGIQGFGTIHIYYGESPEEAMDKEHCETLDKVAIDETGICDLATNRLSPLADTYTLGNAKAFRHVYIETEGDVRIQEVAMDYEFLPEEYRGSFTCDDEEINRIWQIGAYTMHLTSREFFIDGIKRDRWTWSGDAIQSYLMNYYLFFDNETVKRTIWQLRGKDPVTSHINTIMDYTFYWFMSIYDYYLYSGDRLFVQQIYPRMQTLMDYVLSRTNTDGMVEGMAGDWVFVDWADGAMSKRGALAIEQILFCKSLETIALCAELIDNETDRKHYDHLASELRNRLIPSFWNEAKQALVHNVEEGKQSEQVTRYANMFATFFGYLSPKQQSTILDTVLLNDEVMKITTPYMRFYELEAMCVLGKQETVMQEMKDYWGGMLREGATSFWEKYNPEDHGTQHLAMYGRPYGKSLCHAWGASPIYLLGRYYLGVRPIAAGYTAWECRPNLGGLQWMKGDVPTPFGNIHVEMAGKEISLRSDGGIGYLYVSSASRPTTSSGKPEAMGDNMWKIKIETTDLIQVSLR